MKTFVAFLASLMLLAATPVLSAAPKHKAAPQATVPQKQTSPAVQLECIPIEPFLMMAEQMGRVEKVWFVKNPEKQKALIALLIDADLKQGGDAKGMDAPFDAVLIMKHEGGHWGIVTGFLEASVVCPNQSAVLAKELVAKMFAITGITGEDDGGI